MLSGLSLDLDAFLSPIVDRAQREMNDEFGQAHDELTNRDVSGDDNDHSNNAEGGPEMSNVGDDARTSSSYGSENRRLGKFFRKKGPISWGMNSKGPGPTQNYVI